MVQGGLVFRLLEEQVLVIQPFFQDGLHALEGKGLNGESPGTGPLEALGGVVGCQAHDPEAGAKALLGMWPAFHDPGDELLGAGSGLLGPAGDSRGGPFEMLLMGLGHVLGQGGEFSF